MLKLQGLRSDKIWGFENWIASTHANGCQEEFKTFTGGDYPLLVKIIQADDWLSVQIHPDDEKAALYENTSGKTECWYVLSAEENAQLVYGLNGIYTASELRKAIAANTIEDCLRYVDVHQGDFIFIPAGTVHAIGKGLKLLEVQQSCDVTYRFFDWGRGRECHVERAISCIKNDSVRNVGPFPGVFSCQYFTLEEIFVEENYSFIQEKSLGKAIPYDYGLLFVIDGEGTINGEKANQEEIYAVAPGEEITMTGDLHLMKISPMISKKKRIAILAALQK